MKSGNFWCYKNGVVIPTEEATVSVQDIGMLRGFGVYDGIAVINNKPLRLDDHVKRLRNSAAGLGLQVPDSDEQIEKAYDLLAEKMDATRFNTRVILTGGEMIEGLSFNPEKPTFYILAEPFLPLPDDIYTNGSSIVTHEFERQYAQFKTINYISAVVTAEKKRQANAIEVLFVSRGQVLECATSNICIVKDGVLKTPEVGVLKGITRKIVLEITADQKVVEGPVSVEDLLLADEIFITSSFKDIVPIVTVDGRKLFDGPGPVTKMVIERYKKAAGLA
ncbi:MAG TPA: aminotransferase class IV [Candidatus Paceibacterota bacterium]|nr:aminotransferase class IV [Candidatus Paceibacterota bacterium]